MDIVSMARDLAHRAHAGQVDKAGRPYIEHVARVAESVRNDGRCKNEDCNGSGEITHWDTAGCGDPSCCSPATSPCAECDTAEAVAWLHDVIEDCDENFRPEVRNGFPIAVIKAVHALTRTVSGDDRAYYYRISKSQLAMRVKLADIADNSSEERLALLGEKTAARLRRKYAKALHALTAEEAPNVSS